MSIDLVKASAAQVSISLQKKGVVTIPPLRVVADLDVSGSMDSLYRGGTVEEAFKKLLGLAFKFDDNGEIDIFAFDSSSYALPTAKVSDYGNYITRHITNHWGRYGGGTSYGQPLQANMDFLFGQKPASGGFLGGIFGKKPAAAAAEAPALVLFFTDGDPSDGAAADRIIAAAEKANQPVYFHLIGVGTATRFAKLQQLADDYDNCGFINLKSVNMPDAELYDALTTDEFVAWLRKYGAK